MTGQPDQARSGLPLRAWFAAGLLALIGVTCVIVGLQRSTPVTPADPGPAREPQSAASERVRTQPATKVAPALPVRLSIPAIHVAEPLLRLGVNRDKTVQVPTSEDADSPGWFRLGTPPGEVGSAVILGHVDSVRGPAVFYDLKLLVPGDRVDVRRSDGTIARFEVTSVATYPNEKFPARKVYASHGYRGLNLVTCGGAYDQATGYQANVVVFTKLVHTAPAGARL